MKSEPEFDITFDADSHTEGFGKTRWPKASKDEIKR
jgi:hypothetical protein